MFYKHKKEDERLLPNGVIRTVKGYTDDLMVCELKWNKGMFGEPHTHEHVQCGYIIKGTFEATVDEKTSVLHALLRGKQRTSFPSLP